MFPTTRWSDIGCCFDVKKSLINPKVECAFNKSLIQNICITTIDSFSTFIHVKATKYFKINVR